VLDTATWTALAPRSAEAAQRAHKETCEVLAAAGWRVLPAQAGMSLTDLWPAAGAGASAAAGRDSALAAAGVAAAAGVGESSW